LRNHNTFFHSDFIHLHSHQQWIKGSFSSTSLPALVIVCVIDNRYSNRGGVNSQCHFDLHFLYGQGCWVALHIFIGHLYFLSWELSVQFICPFIHWVVDFCRVSFLRPLYVLAINLLSDV
jgi:hypothetical protein